MYDRPEHVDLVRVETISATQVTERVRSRLDTLINLPWRTDRILLFVIDRTTCFSCQWSSLLGGG